MEATERSEQAPLAQVERQEESMSMLPVPVPTPRVVERRVSPLIWALIGAGIGVAGTLFAISAQPKPKNNPTLVAMNTPPTNGGVPPTTGSTGAANLGLPNVSGPETATAPGAVPGGTPNGLPPLDGPVKTDANLPMNPFGDSAAVMPSLPLPEGSPNGLRGMIMPKRFPMPPANPRQRDRVTGGRRDFGSSSGAAAEFAAPTLPQPTTTSTLPKNLPTAPPKLTIPKDGVKGSGKGKASLVNVKQTTNDAQQSARELVAYAARLGGKASQLTEKGADNRPEVKGVLATIPGDKVQQMLKFAAELGAVVEKQSWAGSGNDRKERLQDQEKSRLDSLKRLREALLATYLEDAQPVKEVDEEIAKAQETLKEIKTESGGDKMAVVRIMFAGRG